jgi:N-acetylneuraminic acid mutarotase
VSIIFSDQNPQTAKASSTWIQNTDSDFRNGTLDYTIINGTGENAELRIDINEIPIWIKKTPINSPLKNQQYAMATLYGTKNVLLFGGSRGGLSMVNDTWVYNYENNTWTDKAPNNCPGRRFLPAMASIYNDDKAVVFGGGINEYSGTQTGFTAFYTDTWVYDFSDNIWTSKNPVSNPTKRIRHAMASIIGEKKVVLFGGCNGDFGVSNNETWIYDLFSNTWTLSLPIKGPSSRFGHAMAPIFGTDKILLFGGISNHTTATPVALNDTWIYDVSTDNWNRILPKNAPTVRHSAAMAPIFGTDKILMFGGSDTTKHWYKYYGNGFNDTWIYDLSENTWTQTQFLVEPRGRCMFGMAGVDKLDTIVLFGGAEHKPTTARQILNDTWIYNHSFSPLIGTFISAPHHIDGSPIFKTFNWSTQIPNNTSFKIQLRTASNLTALRNSSFKGPDGTAGTYYNTSPSLIWSGHDYDRWLQFIAYLNKSKYSISPSLQDISINYNCVPESKLITPINGSISNITHPTFSWNFTDIDSNSQSAFQVLISNMLSFKNVMFDSTEIESPEQSYRFTNGTNFTILPNGKWYWKVRTKDSDGDWGPYSQPYNMFIDARPPNSKIIFPKNNHFYNNLTSITGIAFDTNIGTGINKVELTIKRYDENKYWNGSVWISDETWLLCYGAEIWEYNTSSIAWISGTQYGIQTRAWDNATNLEIPNQGIIFNFDNDKPISNIEIPLNNSYHNKLESISGEAHDQNVGSGLGKIEVTIQSVNENKFWNGYIWTFGETFLMAKGTNKWKYNSSRIFWISGNKYKIQSRAVDNITNTEKPRFGNIFTFDDQEVQFSSFKPTSNFESPLKEVEVGITISDTISGVNASSIQYTISTDRGEKWSPWEQVHGFNNGSSINVKLNLTFPNGTDNRIKWRASDIARNGPTESKSYPIIINTWWQTRIPKVKLLAPRNGSIITTTSVELSWQLTNRDLMGIQYDILFDTIIPPEEIIEDNFTDTSLKLNELSDGETYYWTVIPKSLEEGVGSSISGVWSFTINTTVHTPKIILLLPENGSMISSTRPTLVWSVDFEDADVLIYEVYLDTNPNPKEFEQCLNKFYVPKTLKDGTTYYWKIVPLAGNNIWPASEIWSFTVNKNYLPEFLINLSLNPSVVNLAPESIVQVKALVTNLGELIDPISVRIDVPTNTGINAFVNKPNTITILPDGTAVFNITIITSEAQFIETNDVKITVIASSGRAVNYGKVVEEKAEITVRILDEEKPSDKSTSLFEFWNIIFLIIILIIIIALAIFVINRKKHPDHTQEEPQSEEAVTVKPDTLPNAVISVGQLPPPTIPQLPETTVDIESPEPTISTLQAPKLASSTTTDLETSIPQIPQVSQVPQLPPAQISAQPSGTHITLAPTPTVTPPTPTPAPQPTIVTPTLAEPPTAPSGPVVHLPEDALAQQSKPPESSEKEK